MKQFKIILGLIIFTSITTFAQSPRIKLNQITKDTVKGSVLISSPTDSGMVYSRDFYIAYGSDTVLILYGDTLAATSGIISSVLSDGVTITGDGTTGNELKVDTSTVISTIQGLVDSLTNYVTTSTAQTISGAKTFTSNLNVDAKIELNAGDNNVVIGDGAGASLVSGQGIRNVLIGTEAGRLIDSSDHNVAHGYRVLFFNTSGSYNIGVGSQALYLNESGSYNNASGGLSLYANETGNGNIANGFYALHNNLSGSYNIGNAYESLYSNTSGNYNIGSGFRALYSLNSGSDNQAYGYRAARYYGSGSDALTTANGSLFFGSNTRASANGNSNEIVIGKDAIGNGSNSVTIGNDGTIGTATSKIVLNGVSSTGGTNSALYITSGGELTTNSSDERLKTNINSLDSELNTVLNLNPVTYNYTNNLSKTTFGFIAQELEENYPDLVFTNPISKYKGIHYHLFAPILVKAIQEQEQKITDLETTIQALITRIVNLENK